MSLHYRAKICAEIAPIKAQQPQTKLAQTNENVLMVYQLIVNQ